MNKCTLNKMKTRFQSLQIHIVSLSSYLLDFGHTEPPSGPTTPRLLPNLWPSLLLFLPSNVISTDKQIMHLKQIFSPVVLCPTPCHMHHNPPL